MIYIFDDYSLDSVRSELRRGAELVVVEPRVFDLLEYLIRNRDRVVSKDDLIESVWSGRIVSESALASRMSAARQAVGDGGERQRLIRTIARKGHRFVGEVREEEAPPITAAHVAQAIPHPHEQSDKPVVAVLPFENLSGDPEQDYFADGLTEDIITALSLWRSFPVIARNSTHVYKGKSPDIREVGRELGARYVIKGSVRKAGSKVRVTAQLINSVNGHHVCAERYDRNLADIFKLQDELSQQIAATVAPEVGYSQPPARTSIPKNLDAWELVQRGYGHVFTLELESIKKGREYFEQTIKLDSNYARAFTGLAWSYHREFWLDREKFSGEAKKAFIDAARRAVSRDQFDSDAHSILSMTCNWYRESDEALLAAQRAIDLNPSNAHAHEILGVALTLVGRAIEGIASQERAVLLSPRDPRHGVWMWTMGLSYLTARKYKEAVLCSERAIQRHPENPDARLVLVSSLGHLGWVKEARAALDAYRRLVPTKLEQPNLVWQYKDDADNDHFQDGLRRVHIRNDLPSK
jgi:TolB-like protein/Tfp pilus assembly protein PilF